MLFQKMTKRILLTLCVFGLAACSTTPDAPAEEMPVVEETTVVDTIAEPQISEEEKMRMESEQMRSARTIYFEFDDTTVQQQYLSVLEVHAAFLVKSGLTITLEGHADERGTQAYNLALGERRAEAVAQYLMNFGLASGQINVVSYGEERPADEGHMDSSWEKNRRVELNYR